MRQAAVILIFSLVVLTFIQADPGRARGRAIAEYEKMQGVLITFDQAFKVPIEFIRLISRRGDIFCLVPDRTNQEQALAELYKNHIETERFFFIEAPFSGYWPRDYGPIFMQESDRIIAVDFLYNRRRSDDDRIPQMIAEYFGIACRFCPLVHSGGNLIFNDGGTAVSSSLVFKENLNDLGKIYTSMKECVNVEDYLVFDDPTDNYHQHANCWIKFLAKNDIALKEVNEGDLHYRDLQRIKESLEDRGFNVHSIPAPNDEPYLNAFIYNGILFVPLMGTADTDQKALDAYRKAMPQYEVIGIFSHDWLATDALNCRVLPIPELISTFPFP